MTVAGEASGTGFDRVMPYTTAATAIAGNSSPTTHRRPEAGFPRDAGVSLMVFRTGFIPYLNTSTVANGSADQGRKRLIVNFVFWPGCTSTST